jgi:hypothetical protein
LRREKRDRVGMESGSGKGTAVVGGGRGGNEKRA